nr:MAG TPA: hypothetical protein [Caudoviricetes sp.]
MANETGLHTIENYLRGCVGFSVTEYMLENVLLRRGIDPGASVDFLSQRDLDLAEAELLRIAITIPSVRGSVEDADGKWKHKEGQTELHVSDKKEMMRRANDLRVKWGEEKFGQRVINIVSCGMGKRRRCYE